MPDHLDTWIPLAGTMVILVWGLRMVASIMRATAGDPAAKTLLAQALSEKSASGERISFSRIAGAIGMVALASSFVGLGLWIPFALNAPDASQIERLANLGGYFLGGSALFAPYAFNQMSKLFASAQSD